jgi:multimeric flavodoxin WrbA
MRVVAFCGSARRNGNTSILARTVLGELETAGMETELVQLAGKDIRGCLACRKCFEKKDQRCSGREDDVNSCIEKMIQADGIILASPTYFADLTPEMKALMDRAGYVARANDGLFKRKVGAAVVAARRVGAIHAFDSMNHFFFISEMIVPGSNYWNLGFGLDKGDVEKDEEGLQTMKQLGKNMAWLLEKLNHRPADE